MVSGSAPVPGGQLVGWVSVLSVGTVAWRFNSNASLSFCESRAGDFSGDETVHAFVCVCFFVCR